jgi:hypothetical protein
MEAENGVVRLGSLSYSASGKAQRNFVRHVRAAPGLYAELKSSTQRVGIESGANTAGP